VRRPSSAPPSSTSHPGAGGGDEAAGPPTRAEFLRMIAGKGALALGALALGFAIDDVWARVVRGVHLQRERYPKLILGKYRVHHNVVGYAAILAGLFWYPIVLVPLGLGMIIGHRRRDRLFWFIERVG
jgi:hypothetical protein